MSRIRLICPNCDAQYEVPAEVIPEGGRDVQCSNCAHTWFQQHPDFDRDLREELGEEEPEEVWEPEAEEEEDDLQPEPALPPAAEPRRRSLDPQVADVLREEAELERRRRQAEAETFEMQQDLGLEEPSEDGQARRAREARDRMAHIRGEDLPEIAEAEATPEPEEPAVQPRKRPRSEDARQHTERPAAAPESRRDLLPDVEEINQTLRSSSERRVTDAEEGRVLVDDPASDKEKGGFARGFFLIVLLFAAAIAVYASAPQISASVPALAPVLESYVGAVDGLRLWLDGQVTQLMVSLDGMSTEATPAAE